MFVDAQGLRATQLEMARSYWGEDFAVFLTGGDAESGLGRRA